MDFECLMGLTLKERINNIHDLRALFETRFNITAFDGSNNFNVYGLFTITPIMITLIEKEDYNNILVHYCDIDITDYTGEELSELNCPYLVGVFELLRQI